MGVIRQLGYAVNMYATTYDGIVPAEVYSRSERYIWSDNLYDHGYIDSKEGFQCPADDITNNGSIYYNFGPIYPDYWTSYAFTMRCFDVYIQTRPPTRTKVANHAAFTDKQILMGESEANFIQGQFMGRSVAGFRQIYEDQFPYFRHNGKCAYLMLDGHTQSMIVPSSQVADSQAFQDQIVDQFEKCDEEVLDRQYQGTWNDRHVCFWNRYGRGLFISSDVVY